VGPLGCVRGWESDWAASCRQHAPMPTCISAMHFICYYQSVLRVLLCKRSWPRAVRASSCFLRRLGTPLFLG
jgi:hypothetical protein